MEQIYYTQCPMGYGLGASNGYQVKRMTPGYPASSDFRHLTLRAFLPGTRIISPKTLRYRRDGEFAEIVLLTPRDREFETEKGRWGRPGGHFAHALRLNVEEMRRLDHWPAGLMEAPIWRHGDPEATRGRPPDPCDLPISQFANESGLLAVPGLPHGLDEASLAALLTLTAQVTREARTLYLIGPADRHPGVIALLTLAFPPRLRAEITFSTFHDRPEELIGLRIQGTTPEARPNRSLLAGTGLVVDLASPISVLGRPTPEWARSLARDLIHPSETAIFEFAARSRRVAKARWETSEEPWSDDWLDALFLLGRRVASPTESLSGPSGWDQWMRMFEWANRSDLLEEVLAIHGPSWWIERSDQGDIDEPRGSMVRFLGCREAWFATPAALWGRAMALWFARVEPQCLNEAIASIWKSIPSPSRAGFLAALLADSSERRSLVTLDWLRSQPRFDPRILIPLEARQAARSAIDRDEPGPLGLLLDRVFRNDSLVVPTLEAFAKEAAGRHEARSVLARSLARSYVQAEAGSRAGLEAWAFSRLEDPHAWIRPSLARMFEPPEDRESWEAFRLRRPIGQLPMAAEIALQAAQEPGASGGAFVWAIERMLLPLPESRRPVSPEWAEAYLRRTPSDLDLIQKLYAGDVAELKAWIYAARSRGELSADQASRIERVRAFTRVLQAGESAALQAIDLPSVPIEDRGRLLSQMLDHLEESSMGVCLDCCRSAWPGAFQPDSSGLVELARPIARALARHSHDPLLWAQELETILQRLRLTSPGEPECCGYESESLAAYILATTTLGPMDEGRAWKLREGILRDDRRWRILAADARADLNQENPQQALSRFRSWRDRLDIGKHTGRFAEILINACEGPALPTLVEHFVGDLSTLGVIAWWRSAAIPGAANDLREAYARMAPIAPTPPEIRTPLGLWIRAALRPDLPPLLSGLLGDFESESGIADAPCLSSQARERWECLSALSDFLADFQNSGSRLNLLADWQSRPLPLGCLNEADASQFVSWLIAGLDSEAVGRVERFGTWLARASRVNPDLVRRWWVELPAEVQNLEAERAAIASDLWRAISLARREQKESLRKGKSVDSP